MSKGFTLIEVLISTAIVVFLAALVLPNYSIGARDFALQRATHKLAQDLRRAQEMAVSSTEFNNRAVPGGYGLRFQGDASSYILFADVNSNKIYDGPSEIVENIEMERGVVITFLSSLNYLTIIFVPPDPTTIIRPNSSASWAVITLNGRQNIRVNKAGLIEIE